MHINNLIKPSLEKFFPKLSKRFRTNYYIISNIEATPVSKIKNNPTHIPKEATDFTLLIVGKRNNSGFRRNVLTFYRDTNIIKRILTGTDKNPIIREYKTKWYKNNNNNDIFTKNRTIRTKEYTGNRWELKQEEEQFTHYFIKEIINGKFQRKLHINKNTYKNSNNSKLVNATSIEYPSVPYKNHDEVKKTVDLNLSLNKGIPQIDSVSPATNIKLPENDEFLAYRFLLGEQKQTSLTHKMLCQKGVDKLGVNIIYDNPDECRSYSGYFDHFYGDIIYHKITKDHPIIIAAHESEHVRQFSLIGRLGKLKTPFGKRCFQRMRPITDTAQRQEGLKYETASKNYPKITAQDNDLTKKQNYWNNDLEVGARNAANIVYQKYNKVRQYFCDIFKYSTDKTSF